MQRLEPPLLAVGKNDSIVQLLPSSLRFWEKLGLTPRAGRKDVTAYLVLEDGDPSKQRLAEAWLTKISVAYNVSCRLLFFGVAPPKIGTRLVT